MTLKLTPVIEDLNILVAIDTLPEDVHLEDLKSKLKKITNLDLDSIFNVLSNKSIEELTDRALSQFTHIVAQNIEFPKFGLITTKLLIPIVTTEWIDALVKQMGIVPVRAFTPDPRLIFKKATVSCGSTCDDQDIVKTAVRIFGGAFTNELRKTLTHFVTDDPNHKNVKLIEEYNKVNRQGLNVHIVRMSWLFDSILKGECLDENAYRVDSASTSNFGIPKFMENMKISYSNKLNVSQEMKKLLNKFKTKKNTARKVCFETFLDPMIASDVETRSFDYFFTLLLHQTDKLNFDSLLFYPVREIPAVGMHRLIVATTNYTGDSRLYIEELIQRMGGFFTKTLKPSNTHVVSAKDIGKKMEYAKKWNVNIVNHSWVEDCFINWKLVSDDNYHNFFRSADSVRLINEVKFNGFKIDHQTKETMIFTPDTKCGSFADTIVQEVSKGKNDSNILSYNTDLPSVEKSLVKRSLAETQLTQPRDEMINEETLNQTPATIKIVVEGNSKKANNVEEENKYIPKLLRKSNVKQLEKRTEKKDKKSEEMPSSAIDDDNCAEVTKDDSIWEIPTDDSNQNDLTVKTVNIIGETKKQLTKRTKASRQNTKSAAVTVIEIADMSRSKRAASMDSNESDEPSKKIAKTNKKPYDITAIVTGFDGTLSTTDKRELKKIGITIIETPNKSLNCIIAPSLLRTQKFLTSLAYDPKYFLEPLFLTDVLGTLDSVKKNADFDSLAPKLERYDIWKHVDFDKDIRPKRLFSKGTEKDDAIEYLKKQRIDLFKGFSFNVSSGLPAGFETLKSILKSFGCKTCVKFSEKSKTVKVNDEKAINNADFVAILVCGIDEHDIQSHFSDVCLAQNLKYVALQWDTIVTFIFEAGLPINKDNCVIESGVIPA